VDGVDDTRYKYSDVRRQIIEGIVYGVSIYGYQVLKINTRKIDEDTIRVSLTIKSPYRIRR